MPRSDGAARRAPSREASCSRTSSTDPGGALSPGSFCVVAGAAGCHGSGRQGALGARRRDRKRVPCSGLERIGLRRGGLCRLRRGRPIGRRPAGRSEPQHPLRTTDVRHCARHLGAMCTKSRQNLPTCGSADRLSEEQVATVAVPRSVQAAGTARPPVTARTRRTMTAPRRWSLRQTRDTRMKKCVGPVPTRSRSTPGA